MDLVQAKAPLLVFLVETWKDEARLNYVKDCIRFDQKVFVERINKGGGLALFWKDGIEADVETSSLNHIDVTINKNSNKPWRFTGFYRGPETQKRFESWDLLRHLHRQSSLPWLCAKDFNEITKQSEKSGGRLRPSNQMQQFRDTLDGCGFMDLGFMGFPFTWSKHWQNGFYLSERLDRAIASQEWFKVFPGTKVHHIDNTTSDHKFLWIEIADLDFQWRKKLFRFEETWLADKRCGEVV